MQVLHQTSLHKSQAQSTDKEQMPCGTGCLSEHGSYKDSKHRIGGLATVIRSVHTRTIHDFFTKINDEAEADLEGLIYYKAAHRAHHTTPTAISRTKCMCSLRLLACAGLAHCAHDENMQRHCAIRTLHCP
eukprot:6460149-Amphidinium_carterae.1